MQRSLIRGFRGADTGSLLPNVLGLELAQIMERMIICLQFPPGAHLTEQEICARFNVSRSPVREAFRQLEADGLVVRETRKGIRVTPMTHEGVDEIYFVRTPLESIGARCATKNATKEDLVALERAVSSLETALKKNDSEMFFEANVEYFDRIHSMTGNATLENILRMIEKQAMRYRYFAHAYSKEMQENSAVHLRSVLASIKEGDSEKAYRRTEKMMTEAHTLIVKILRQNSHLTQSAPL